MKEIGRGKFDNFTDTIVKDAVVAWLRHSKDRYQRELQHEQDIAIGS